MTQRDDIPKQFRP